MTTKRITRSVVKQPTKLVVHHGQAAATVGLPADGLISALDATKHDTIWADMTKTTPALDGGSVAVWEDASGNGNDWSQSDPALRPVAGLQNNRIETVNPTPKSSAGQHLQGPDLSGLSEGHFFARVQSPNNTQGGVWACTTWNSPNSASHWDYVGTHYMSLGTQSRSNVPTGWWNPVLMTDLVTYDECITSGGVRFLHVDGTEVHSASGQTVAFGPLSVLGSAVRSGAVQYSGDFHFYRFCAYDRAITDPQERQLIYDWLEA